MSHAIESMERAEKVEAAGHGGHGGHGGGNALGKYIGLTMALIGVLVALCAAFVGGERNEMTRAMIEQARATSDATSASTKFRLVMIAIEQVRHQADAPASQKERFVALYRDYSRERALTDAWAKSYDGLVEARFHATEAYERAQLLAEIGIVFASLALLLSRKEAWWASMLLAALCVGQVGMTMAQTEGHVEHAQSAIAKAEGDYKALRAAHVGNNADEVAAKALDPDGSISKALEAAEKAAVAKTPKAAESDKPGHADKAEPAAHH